MKKAHTPKHVGVTATAIRWGVSRQLVAYYYAAGRIPGSTRIDSELGRVEILIPANARKPAAMKPGPKPSKSKLENAQP